MITRDREIVVREIRCLEAEADDPRGRPANEIVALLAGALVRVVVNGDVRAVEVVSETLELW